jgi:hypothetical protein
VVSAFRRGKVDPLTRLPPLALVYHRPHPHIDAIMTLELIDEEEAALAALLTYTIQDDRYPLSPRIRTLKSILAKIEPPRPVITRPLPALRPCDRPRAALSAIKRRRRG